MTWGCVAKRLLCLLAGVSLGSTVVLSKPGNPATPRDILIRIGLLSEQPDYSSVRGTLRGQMIKRDEETGWSWYEEDGADSEDLVFDDPELDDPELGELELDDPELDSQEDPEERDSFDTLDTSDEGEALEDLEDTENQGDDFEGEPDLNILLIDTADAEGAESSDEMFASLSETLSDSSDLTEAHLSDEQDILEEGNDSENYDQGDNQGESGDDHVTSTLKDGKKKANYVKEIIGAVTASVTAIGGAVAGFFAWTRDRKDRAVQYVRLEGEQVVGSVRRQVSGARNSGGESDV